MPAVVLNCYNLLPSKLFSPKFTFIGIFVMGIPAQIRDTFFKTFLIWFVNSWLSCFNAWTPEYTCENIYQDKNQAHEYPAMQNWLSIWKIVRAILASVDATYSLLPRYKSLWLYRIKFFERVMLTLTISRYKANVSRNDVITPC